MRNHPGRFKSTHSRRRLSGLGAGAGACALLAALAPGAAAAQAGGPAPAVARHSQVVRAGGGTVPLHRVGTVNLSALARTNVPPATARAAAAAAPAQQPAAAATSPGHVVPLGLPPRPGRQSPRTSPVGPAGTSGRLAGNVAGEKGFDGITADINGGANSPDIGGAGDVTPPDQGLAAGPSPAGPVIVEMLNDSLSIYSPSGKTLLGAIPSFEVFGQRPSTTILFSDPRVYWDPQTGHWFLTQFIFGFVTNGKLSNPSTEFMAVSQTADPFGPYTVFSINTTDTSTAGCPCFGDYDMLGLDTSGLFIETNEFSDFGVPNATFNGSIIYAVSKQGLIAAARGSGPLPSVQRYRVPVASDPFGSFHLAPDVTTQGSPGSDNEYFTESNGAGSFGSSLEVYALPHTSVLRHGGRPGLVRTLVKTEAYSVPPNAVQKNGPFPFGQSLGQSGVAVITTDFDAVQEVTAASGLLYAELDTGYNAGTGQRSAAAWFVLRPAASPGKVSAARVSNGYVKTPQFVMYPVIGVDAHGHGYLAFSFSSADRFPSDGYVTFDGSKGAGSVVHVAASGVNPLDDFGCYPPNANGVCRMGDYSMAQNFDGKIYLGSEYVPPQPRDIESNWGTRIWYAPVP